jgi:hypothetical protein
VYDLCVCLYDFKILKSFYYTVAKNKLIEQAHKPLHSLIKPQTKQLNYSLFQERYGNKVVKAKA